MTQAQKLSAQEIIQFIGNAEKKTQVKVTLSGMPSFKSAGFLAENGRPNFKALANKGIQVLGDFHTHYSLKIIIGDWQAVRPLLEGLTENKDYTIEFEGRNSAVPLLDTRAINARIEPGAIIRDQVTIGDNAVIMMGAIINIGAEIGEGTMIDMGAVLGGRATVGKNSHIGAGAVLAGSLSQQVPNQFVWATMSLLGQMPLSLKVSKSPQAQSLLQARLSPKTSQKMLWLLVSQLESLKKLMKKQRKKLL